MSPNPQSSIADAVGDGFALVLRRFLGDMRVSANHRIGTTSQSSKKALIGGSFVAGIFRGWREVLLWGRSQSLMFRGKHQCQYE